MSLRVSGKTIDIGEALRVRVTDRLQAVTAKYLDGGASGHAIIAPEGSGFRAEGAPHSVSGVVLQADRGAHEPYGSADRIEKRISCFFREHLLGIYFALASGGAAARGVKVLGGRFSSRTSPLETRRVVRRWSRGAQDRGPLEQV